MKLVFGVDSSNTLFPIVAEEMLVSVCLWMSARVRNKCVACMRAKIDGSKKSHFFSFSHPRLLLPSPLLVQLDDDNGIEQMEIFDGFLYINTLSHLYRVPLERCSRYKTCQECAGSRDPYCVWNTNNNGSCVRSTLSATDSELGDVPSK